MDETSYSDPRVIVAVNEHFIPIRVDNDRHPDVNRRYNMGGWPTTAFLTASGDVLTGATYLPPDQMLESLARVKAFSDANRAQIVALDGRRASTDDGPLPTRLTDLPRRRGHGPKAGATDPDLPCDPSAEIAQRILGVFDEAHGGVGTEPKFPQPDVFSFLLAYGSLLEDGSSPDDLAGGAAATVPDRVRKMVRTTLTEMAKGGLYDQVEGGFFRYATKRDWSIPHYEKMLADNADLASLYLEASLLAAEHDIGDADAYRRVAGGTLDYLLAVLRLPGVPAFGGSQDADERYYLLDATGRAGSSAPSVDPTVYVDWNASAARALLRGARLLSRPELTRHALDLLEHLHTTARHGDPMAHYMLPGRPAARGAPLLGDQVAVAAAFLDAYESTADRRWLRRAQSLVDWTCGHLCAPDGRLADRLTLPGESAGLLAQPVPALNENAAAAEVMLRLSALTGDPRPRDQALEVLVAWMTQYERYGVAAAPYGQALLRYMEHPGHIVVVGSGDDPETQRLHAAALMAPLPLRTVQRLDPTDPDDAAHLARMGLAGQPGTAAAGYLCRDRTCSSFHP